MRRDWQSNKTQSNQDEPYSHIPRFSARTLAAGVKY
jgi:hypothetical protein